MRIACDNMFMCDLGKHTNKCKQTKLTILSFNQELISIMVKKGRIHKEIGEFFRYSSNLIQSDDQLRREIMDFKKFGKKTLRRIYGIIKLLHLDYYSLRNEEAKSKERN